MRDTRKLCCTPSTTTQNAPGFERIERAAGQFTRRFTLPDNAVPQQIKARFNHGVLEVSIPKQAEISAHRITVEAA